MSKSEMRFTLEKVLKDYITSFEDKQDMRFEFAVNDNFMGVISFGCTYYLSIEDIVYDIDKELPKGLIIQWMDDNLEYQEKSQFINLHAYSKGLRHKDVAKL